MREGWTTGAAKGEDVLWSCLSIDGDRGGWQTMRRLRLLPWMKNDNPQEMRAHIHAIGGSRIVGTDAGSRFSQNVLIWHPRTTGRILRYPRVPDIARRGNLLSLLPRSGSPENKCFLFRGRKAVRKGDKLARLASRILLQVRDSETIKE